LKKVASQLGSKKKVKGRAARHDRPVGIVKEKQVKHTKLAQRDVRKALRQKGEHFENATRNYGEEKRSQVHLVYLNVLYQETEGTNLFMNETRKERGVGGCTDAPRAPSAVRQPWCFNTGGEERQMWKGTVPTL